MTTWLRFAAQPGNQRKQPPLLEVIEALGAHAKHRPNATAFVNGDRSLTFQELASYAGGLARKAASLPEPAGIYAPNCLEWAVADLALSHAGKTVVPLPVFFSAQQLSHIIADAGIKHVLTVPPMEKAAHALGVPYSLIRLDEQGPLDGDGARFASCVIYTSGSTGKPKGVRLGGKQIGHSAKAIMSAAKASPQDRYLSVLPYSLLLERICGICIPLLSGAAVYIADGAAQACANGDPRPLMEQAKRFKPTVSVLTPDLLKSWTLGLNACGEKAPPSLRLVAVGGAPTPQALVEAALSAGIPAHEGYGLSECCSVVSLNRAGNNVPGTAGALLDGIEATIEDGEIVVKGPTVMDGYLNGPEAGEKWRTGDLGSFGENGLLRIIGRKDNLLVTAAGRNVSPEWIEGLVASDPKIDGCILIGHGRLILSAILVPSHGGSEWFKQADEEAIAALISGLCREAPEYARPGRHIVASMDYLRSKGLLAPNGQPRRHEIAKLFS